VCEGCGDCGVKSNCVAIVPRPTALGRKRAVDVALCNADLLCNKVFFLFSTGPLTGTKVHILTPVEVALCNADLLCNKPLAAIN